MEKIYDGIIIETANDVIPENLNADAALINLQENENVEMSEIGELTAFVYQNEGH